MDPAIATHVRETLAARGVTEPRCSLCGASGWDAWTMQLAGVSAPGQADATNVLRMQRRIELVCQVCANVLSLRASALGIVSLEPAPDE